MAIVLCIGVREGLIESRKLILEKAGHRVVRATTLREIVDACRKFHIDVALIGQIGDTSLKREWAALVRLYSPWTKILEIYAPNSGASVNTADSWMESPASPWELTDRVTYLSSPQRKVASA